MKISNGINIEDSDSTLTFTKGTNNNRINGNGTVKINGNVTNNAEIQDNMTIVTNNSTLENNSTITGSLNNKGIIKGNGELKLTGDSTTENSISNVISLIYDKVNNKKATLTVGNSSADNVITLSKDIVSDNSENTVTFTGSSDVDFQGKFDPLSAEVAMDSMDAIVMRSGQDSDINWTLTKGTLYYAKDSYLSGGTNTMNFNGGNLDLRNFTASTINLKNITLSKDSNIYIDADLANRQIDNLGYSSATILNNAKLHIAGLNIVSLPNENDDYLSINFTQDENLKRAVDYTAEDSISYSPIFKYNVNYDSNSGDLNFVKDFEDPYNPAIMAAPVAAQLGGFLNQVNSYEEAFYNMDMRMLSAHEERTLYSNYNNSKGVWFKPYITFEKVDLNNGPEVKNRAYGGLVGCDSEMISYRNGWDAMYTVYAGYNGSYQNYDSLSMYQNGGLLGLTGTFYKGNFFTGVTANIGASIVDANTMYGREEFTMLATGIANKTGYNFEFFGGDLVVQPNLSTSYSFINTFNYTNAADVEISSDPLNAIQIAPGLKLIANLPGGWKPYAGIKFVWNLMDKTKFNADNLSLPDLSVDPYLQYSLGVQKSWADRFTGSAQITLRSGGRKGISLNAGFKYELGKKVNNKPKSNVITLDRNINLSVNKNVVGFN